MWKSNPRSIKLKGRKLWETTNISRKKSFQTANWTIKWYCCVCVCACAHIIMRAHSNQHICRLFNR